MKFTAPWILCGWLVLCVCASRVQTVTRPELQAIINRHATESGSWVRYAGAQDGYHYLVNNRALSSRTYRVAATELRIADTFPYAKDRKAWRSLRWDLQPLGGEGVSGKPISG